MQTHKRENRILMQTLNMFDLGVEDTHYQYKKQFKQGQTVRLFESFAGIGCQRMALNKLGIPYESVGISEIDKYALMSYQAIHSDCNNYGDITKMTEIPECDIFTWSFPCQDLSKLGKQKGLQGTRSGLVYEVIRLLKATEIKPKVLIMENVPDLVGAKFIGEFTLIKQELEEMGYKNFVSVLNAKDYGVPQNRERVFMVSILDNSAQYSFPIEQLLKTRLKDVLEENVDEKYYLSEKALKRTVMGLVVKEATKQGFAIAEEGDSINLSRPNSKTRRGRVGKDVAQTLLTGQEQAVVIGELEIAPTQYAQEHYGVVEVVGSTNPSGKGMNGNVYNSNGLVPTLTTNKGEGLKIVLPEKPKVIGGVGEKKSNGGTQYYQQDRIYSGDGIALTHPANLPGGSYKYQFDNLRIRKLTPKECWRLMGIADSDFEKASKAVTNSQLYKQAGNGIVVNVFAEILKGLFEMKERENKND